MLMPNQSSIEFSQDLGHAERIFTVGDRITLQPNKAKINVFSTDSQAVNLIKDVKQYE
jgi:iron(III) transport system ATP-binding protein